MTERKRRPARKRAATVGDAWMEMEAKRQRFIEEQRAIVQANVAAACHIIERGDNRLLASDGPAGNQPPDLSLTDWRHLYLLLKGAREAGNHLAIHAPEKASVPPPASLSNEK